MKQPFTPRPYQTIAADHIINTPRCAVWVPMGGGKCASVLMALDHLSLTEDVYPALIVAPKRVAKNTWPAEIEKWVEFQHLSITPIVGSESERKAALRKNSQYYSVNLENLEWLVKQLGEKWQFKTIIADESSRLRGFRITQGTKRSHALFSKSHLCNRFIELTGTPSPNGLSTLWGQMFFLDKGQRLGKSFSAFEQRWFRLKRDGYGLEALGHSPKEIQGKLRDICLSIDLKDYMDVKEPVINKVFVELPDKVRKLYKNMEKEFFMQVGDHSIEAFNAASKSGKLLQLVNGAVYVDEDAEKWEEVHKAKLEALESIIEESAGMPVLVVYNFRSDLARLKKHFPDGKYFDDSRKTEDDWNAGKIPLMFIHPASGGHGCNLQYGSNIMTFFGLTWDLELHQQVSERIGPVRQLQAGLDRPVFMHYIIAKNTIDELVMQRLIEKKSIQDILLEALKHRT